MTVAEFKATFPEFSSRSDGDVQAALNEAALFVGEKWEEYTNLGLGNYAAHKLVWEAVTANDATTSFDHGAVVSKSVGGVSVGRSSELVKMQFLEPLNCTKYGRLYLYYARIVGAGATTV